MGSVSTPRLLSWVKNLIYFSFTKRKEWKWYFSTKNLIKDLFSVNFSIFIIFRRKKWNKKKSKRKTDLILFINFSISKTFVLFSCCYHRKNSLLIFAHRTRWQNNIPILRKKKKFKHQINKIQNTGKFFLWKTNFSPWQ